jgi:hypothetical protein
MLYLTIVLFAVSAVLGLTILIKWLSKKEASRAVVYSHGIVAAAGIAFLVAYAVMNPESFPKTSLILFSIAAIAGFYMFFNDLAKKPSPMVLAFVHALVAVGGFLTLLFFVFS